MPSTIAFTFSYTSTTEIYTLSLHDALPITAEDVRYTFDLLMTQGSLRYRTQFADVRSEEHTSELQSHHDLVCRLLLEKKKSHRRNKKIGQSQQTYPDNNKRRCGDAHHS